VLDGLPDKLLTVRDVAAALSVSAATVYALCRFRELRRVRILNAIRIVQEDFDASLAARRR
jgi:excisionase family DNA binding protein